MGSIDFRFYLALFLRRFPYFALTALAVSTIGVTIAYLLPPIYQAEASITAESPQIRTDLDPSSTPSEVVRQLELIKLQMMTRSNLLAVAKRMGLYGATVGASDDDIVNDMRSRTRVEPIQTASTAPPAFIVSYRDTDPVLAANVANEFVNIIVQKGAHLRNDQAVDTLDFFKDEAETLSRKLTQLENELLQFKTENKDALPETLAFRRNQLMTHQERLMQLDREEASLRDGRSRLLQVYAMRGRLGTTTASTPEGQTLEQLRRALIEQRMIFSETSPGISALQSQIAALEKSIQSSGADALSTQRPPPEVAIEISDIERRIALVSIEKKALQQSMAQSERSISATAANETALNALDRQRQNLQAQYNMAVTKMAEASARQRIASESKGERLSVLELAVPPRSPIGPKRMAIAVGSIAAGLGLGAGLIVLLEMLNGTVRRPLELIEILDIEPLATIPYIPLRGEVSSKDTPSLPATIRRAIGG
jgi:polysaccharide biosynthesis transport protein